MEAAATGAGRAGGGRGDGALVGQGRDHDTRTPDVETSSDAYAARFAGPVGRWMLEVQAQQVRALLASASTGPLDVLELGGGHGQLAGPLSEAGHRVTVHASRAGCHRRLAPLGSRVGRVVSELWRLPFREGRFDAVVGVRLLAHVEEPRALLAEMARVSARFVLVDFPVQGALHRLAPLLFGAKRRLEGNTRPYFAYVPGRLEAELHALGLRRRGQARLFCLPMAAHRGARSPALSRGLEGAAARLGLTPRLGSPMLVLAEHHLRREP